MRGQDGSAADDVVRRTDPAETETDDVIGSALTQSANASVLVPNVMSTVGTTVRAVRPCASGDTTAKPFS